MLAVSSLALVVHRHLAEVDDFHFSLELPACAHEPFEHWPVNIMNLLEIYQVRAWQRVFKLCKWRKFCGYELALLAGVVAFCPFGLPKNCLNYVIIRVRLSDAMQNEVTDAAGLQAAFEIVEDEGVRMRVVDDRKQGLLLRFK